MEGRELVKEALADVKALREAAVESAKKEILEDMTPTIRRLVEKNLGKQLSERSRTQGYEHTREQKQDYDGAKVHATDEAVEPVAEELTLEDALQELFPDGEVKESKKMESKKSSKKSSVKETTEPVAEAKSSAKSSVKEEIEISEAELRKIYQEALQTEVQVKKGFGDITNFVELGGKTGGNDHDPADPKTGKAGVKPFEEEEPPAKKDWIPEQKLRAVLQRGLAENKALRENLRKAATMIETLGKKLHEVNLFNAKVLHVNRILNSGARLTREQKEFVMNSIDEGRTISEVKMIYKTLVGSMSTQAAAMTEGRVTRPPKANASRPRTTGTPDQQVLSESVDKGGANAEVQRFKELAGILK